MSVAMDEKKYQDIVDMGIKLTGEKDCERLMNLLMDKGMEITGCDGALMYLYEDGELHFHAIKILSLNICIAENNSNNVEKYDSIRGYDTQSIMVVPLENNDNDIIGVLQLMNAMDEDGSVIPFQPEFEKVMFSLAAQSAITISNIRYVQELKELLYSFVEAMGTAVDQRTPYNGNHTRKVTKYADKFVDYLNECYENGDYEEVFHPNRKEQLVMAAALHDIGKLVTPRSVMNKSTRLANQMDKVTDRMELLSAYLKIDYLEHRIEKNKYIEEKEYLKTVKELVQRVNTMESLDESSETKIKQLAQRGYEKLDGTLIPYLEKEEIEALLIKKGTLTAEERRVMENHVSMTSRILEEIHFSHSYRNVARWAGSHHELLDGTGYPTHLIKEQIPTEIRILTMLDIYDALTSDDRPYKEAISVKEAIKVLEKMAEEGKLDGQLVTLFSRYLLSA